MSRRTPPRRSPRSSPSTSPLSSRHTPPRRSPLRSRVPALAPLLLLLALGACGGSAASGPAATTEVGAALADLDLGPDTDLTPDGDQLGPGHPGVYRVASAADPADPDYRELLLASTVVEIVEADPGVTAGLQLPDGAPYLVRLDHRVLDSEGTGQPEDLGLEFVGISENGRNLPTVQAGVGDQAVGECAAVPFDSLEAGGVGRSCIVVVGTEGDVVGGAAWSGHPVLDGTTPETNPYLMSPLMWRQ